MPSIVAVSVVLVIGTAVPVARAVTITTMALGKAGRRYRHYRQRCYAKSDCAHLHSPMCLCEHVNESADALVP